MKITRTATRITGLSVNWNERFANRPTLLVEFNGAPPAQRTEQGVWVKRGGVHRRDTGIFVDYFYTDGQPNQGYGGRLFEGILDSGVPFKYQGVWSARAAVVNAAWSESPIVDVVWEHTHGALTVESVARFWLENSEHLGFKLGVIDDADVGLRLEPLRMDGTPKPTLEKTHVWDILTTDVPVAEFIESFTKGL